jgi:Phospholipase_D-nuclease N-terminal
VAVSVVIDIFRSPDLSGAAKAGWVLVVMVLPLLGALIYIIARGDKMKQHEIVAQVDYGATMVEKDFQRARKSAERAAGQQRNQATQSPSARA